MAYSYCWCCETSGTLYCSTSFNALHRVPTSLSGSLGSASITGNSLQKIRFDSSGNVYVADGSELYKFSTSLGSELWNTTNTALEGYTVGIAVDSTNGWVYCGCTPGVGSNSVRKFDASDGTEITSGGWPYYLGVFTNGGNAFSATCDLDSNLDLWVGHAPTTGTGNPSLTKLDYDGSKIADYQPFQAGGSHKQWPQEILIDSNDNVYCSMTAAGNNVTENLVKLNSSGVKQWGKAPDSSSQNEYGLAINFNEDLIAVCGEAGAGSDDDIWVYNDSGTLQWSDRQNRISYSCVFDEDNNLYVAVQDTTAAPYDSIVRYDDTGTQDGVVDVGGYSQAVNYLPA